MKKIISLLLALALIFPAVGCNKQENPTEGNTNSTDNTNQSTDKVPTIVVPDYKDYGRSSVDFDKLVYSRPDLATAISKFSNVTATVRENTLSFEEQLELIEELSSVYSNTEAMYTLAEIYTKKDSSIEFWKDEFLYISSNYPAFIMTVEDLLVACAASEHKERFESEYFGYSLDEYTDGGDYTDVVVALLEQEAIKEAEYSSLSTATVTITYKSVAGFTFQGTVDDVYKQTEEKFGKDSTQYKNATIAINDLYNQRLKELSLPIYVDLLKIRRLIADELGYDSYAELAYKDMGYDYSPEDMKQLLKNISTYITPVTERLNSVTFTSYFQKNNQPRVDRVNLINMLYSSYKNSDAEFLDAYSYMLQHNLYDINPGAQNRFNGAFTAYIHTNNSPFVFMSTSGFIKDYTTLAHEFGHFYDGFVNDGADTSTHLAEVSSQGLEYITLLRLRNLLKMDEYEYLEYLTMYNTLNSTLLEQSFYSTFEHMAYDLSYDEISSKTLSTLANDAFVSVYGRELSQGSNLLQHVIIPHTVMYPFYVESYVSSAIPALEIFFMESYRTGEAGKGLAVYKQLVSIENSSLSFDERLESVGLSSPFKQDTVKNIANLIHYQILGKDYFISSDTAIDAA